MNAGLGRSGFTEFLERNAAALRGRSHDELAAVADRLFESKIAAQHVVGNELEVVDGTLTGKLAGPIVWEPARRTGRWSRDEVQDRSGAQLLYADGDEDAAVMYEVGTPRPTNPRKGLAAVAADEGWPTISFPSRGRGGPIAASGLSLIISPEGTRSKTGEVLPFRKGLFRIAMATDIRNRIEEAHRS